MQREEPITAGTGAAVALGRRGRGLVRTGGSRGVLKGEVAEKMKSQGWGKRRMGRRSSAENLERTAALQSSVRTF